VFFVAPLFTFRCVNILCSIKRDILPVVLSLCQDVDHEVRACMSRLLDPVARCLGYGTYNSHVFVPMLEM